jgi:hypothetical protein
MVAHLREMARETKRMRSYREAAQSYVDDEFQVDDTAVVSVGDDDGAWVSTWTWISD